MNRQLLENWTPVIESTIGTDGMSAEKKELVATICQLQENYESTLYSNGLNENNQFATLGSVNGMGAVQLPNTQGNGWSTGDKGSGDVPGSLLPLAMQLAGQTIGLELVPTAPMNGPVGMLSYMDFVYAGGKSGYAPLNSIYPEGTSGASKNSPIYIKVKLSDYSAIEAGVEGVIGVTGASSGQQEDVTILGQSRIDGYAILKLPRELKAGNTVASLIPGTGSNLTIDSNDYAIDGKAELVKALEDHVSDFTNNGNNTTTEGMSRLEGETTPSNTGNLTLFSRSVEAKTIDASAAVTREQLHDLKQFGIDAVAQANQFLANEMTQQVNKDILKNIFDLGKTNHDNIEAVYGTNFHLVIGATNANLTVGTDPEVSTDDWTYFGSGKVIKQVDGVNLGAENLSTRQRRLMSRLLAVSNVIATRGRRGPATFAVCSPQTASGLQDISGFQAYPIANTINQVPGALYPIGTLVGISIYVDPNMAYGDGRIAIGRKGDGNSPGLVFMPYVMADSVETIAEGTMAPKMQMKSRYALVHAGHHPETMYCTIGTKNLVDQFWA